MFRRVTTAISVRYHSSRTDTSFTIRAHKYGISLAGRWPVLTAEESVVVEEYIARARVHHQHLANGWKVPLDEAEVDRIIAVQAPLY